MQTDVAMIETIDRHIRDGDEMALTEYVISLPADAIPELLWKVMARRRLLDRLEDVLEARATATGLKEWTAPTGEAFVFKVGSKRVVTAPQSLKNALLDAVIEAVGSDVLATGAEYGNHPHLEALRVAFRENEPTVLLTQLDTFLALDPRYAEAAERFVTWENAGPSHLKEKYVRP